MLIISIGNMGSGREIDGNINGDSDRIPVWVPRRCTGTERLSLEYRDRNGSFTVRLKLIRLARLL